MKLIEMFDRPKLIGLIADIHTGKSNALYHIVETLRAEAVFNLCTFGFKFPFEFAHQIYSLEELEQIEDSIIIIDETFSLFDLENRAKKKQIENTLRLLNHSNCILILCLLPENCKKFLASKLDILMFKKCTIADFINGSMVKRIIQGFCGEEKGTTVLNVSIGRLLIYDGKGFYRKNVPYYEKYDSKKNNSPIVKPKKEATNEG